MNTGFEAVTSATLLGRLKDFQDEQAWQDFFRRYVPMIQSWCRRNNLEADDVEEVTGIVLAALARSMPSFTYDPDKGFRKWLKTVVHHEIVDLWRARQRKKGDRGSGDSKVQEMLLQSPAGMESFLDELNAPLEQRRQWLSVAMQNVQQRYADAGSKSWDAFWLSFMEQRPIRDVAKQLGLTYGAVGSAVYRIKREIEDETLRVENQN
jgi:RNA polymerase sigma-70 factor (ECF subfamily)